MDNDTQRQFINACLGSPVGFTFSKKGYKDLKKFLRRGFKVSDFMATPCWLVNTQQEDMIDFSDKKLLDNYLNSAKHSKI